MSVQEFDVLVLGAGNAIDVPRLAGAAGMRVALIEKGPLGGTCPNRGCIPSKLVIAHADAANAVRDAGRFHAHATLDGVDATRILRDVRAYTDRFDHLLEDDLPESVTLFRGHGAFVDPRTVAVGDHRLTAKRIVIATGSRPPRPDALGAPYWTSDEFFLAETAPASVTVVGGGYVAVELAHFLQGVGIETRVIVRDGMLLRAEDAEIRQAFTRAFVERVPVTFFTEVVGVAWDGSSFTLTLQGRDGYQGRCRSDALLYAIGRVPNSDRIGLEAAGVRTDDAGFVEVNDRLETNVDGVYALGDVTGRHMFTHAASFEATYLGEILTDARDGPLSYDPMPHAVFADPEIAGVGETEEQLREKGVDYVKAAAAYDSVTKGRAIKERHGLAKLLLARDGRILGCHITGAHASILIHQVLSVMKWRNHVDSLTEMIYIHPSLPELIRGIARKAKQQLGR